MKRIIAKGKHGWAVYLKPAGSVQRRHMEQTHGRQFDPIERRDVTGSIPVPMERIGLYETKAAALNAPV